MNFHDALLQALAQQGLDTSYVPEHPVNADFAAGAATSLGVAPSAGAIRSVVVQLDSFGNAVVQSWADLSKNSRDLFAGKTTDPTETQIRATAHEAEQTYENLVIKAVDVLFNAEYELFPPANPKPAIANMLLALTGPPGFLHLPVNQMVAAAKAWPVKLDEVMNASVADLVASRIAEFAPSSYKIPGSPGGPAVTLDHVPTFRVTEPGSSVAPGTPSPGTPDIGPPPPRPASGTDIATTYTANRTSGNGLIFGGVALISLFLMTRR